MFRNLKEIKGIGPAKAKALEDAGIKNIYDLLYYFPRRHIDRSISETTVFKDGQSVTLIVTIESHFLIHGKKTRLVVNARTLSGESIKFLFFHGAMYFVKVFEAGLTAAVSGKLEYRGGMQMVHPDFEFFDSDDEDALLHVGRIVPLYPSTETLKKKGLDSRGFRRLISAAFSLKDLVIDETLPETILKKHGFMQRSFAIKEIHFPENRENLNESYRRLKYEELYLFSALMHEKIKQRNREKRKLRPLAFQTSPLYKKLLSDLPFSLTDDQKTAIQEILKLSENDFAAAVLLQGDVGSGKTLAALAVMLHYTDRQIQAAIMAPTEVLARQHFKTITDFMGIQPGLHIELLTGSDKKKKKESVLEGLRSGEINCIIGTHSLIEDSVEFKNLGLVIIDEQHRFGVNQRESLRLKGKNPDVIAMTATPIPRSLCLTEFADLDLVVLKEKPAGRMPIQTMRLGEDKRKGLYKSIRNHVGNGRQCYIVYPVIDESKNDLKAAVHANEELSTAIFPEFRVELLHGRMKSDEKERIMNDFRSGSVQILVTTTVIEVGVDVPNATIMVIEHAERFGISQLHQLRGRVGRGSEESFCILMAENVTEEGEERLEALVKSDDGFFLSEVDMKLRGPGELLGYKQHGISGLRLSNLVEDRELAETAYRDIREIFELNDAAKEAIRRQFNEGVDVFPN
ncbi:MAG: ATP-dependent DNA helicase RecG [Spirochaetia bacterium]|nr:ATP-dependent DNA helicase RecG [Spirochaetia bacterium]